MKLKTRRSGRAGKPLAVARLMKRPAPASAKKRWLAAQPREEETMMTLTTMMVDVEVVYAPE